jgi:hypothetical protein
VSQSTPATAHKPAPNGGQPSAPASIVRAGGHRSVPRLTAVRNGIPGVAHGRTWITDTSATSVTLRRVPSGLMTVQEQPVRTGARAPGDGAGASVSELRSVLQASAVRPHDERPDFDEPQRTSGGSVCVLPAAGPGPVPNTGTASGPSVQGDVTRAVWTTHAQRGAARPSDPGDGRRSCRRSHCSRATAPRENPQRRPTACRGAVATNGHCPWAERLTRHVNALIERSRRSALPSAPSSAPHQVGDCNEHTALYVAMAQVDWPSPRASRWASSTAARLLLHAWAEVYVRDAQGGAVAAGPIPRSNEFPATDPPAAARGRAARQAAILPLVGRLRMTSGGCGARPSDAARRRRDGAEWRPWCRRLGARHSAPARPAAAMPMRRVKALSTPPARAAEGAVPAR